jgi:ribosomal protein S18 acetylase RimI-like enzyme
VVRAGRAEGLRLLSRAEVDVRVADVSDAPAAARLLHDFNTEFDSYTPGVEALTERLSKLLTAGTITVLLAGQGPDAIAQLRFYPSIWTNADDAVLEELYVVPALRGSGIGRALIEAAITAARARGAAVMELSTSESDTAAIGL